MSSKTRIGWTDSTWNPITGCSRVSEGCRHCYAERLAGTRLANHEHYKGLTRISRGGGEPKWTGEVRFHSEEDVICEPLRWRKPRRVFVNSMGDLFHEKVPDDWLYGVYGIMRAADWHVYLVLTKRAQRMAEWLRDKAFPFRHYPYIWHGTSCENQQAADERIPHLLTLQCYRFLSLEPLLGKIDLGKHLTRHGFSQIHWVIVGGESGKGYRECQVEWIEDIVRQCREEQVPVFVKQDSHYRSGQQGRIPDWLWAVKEYPEQMLEYLKRNSKSARKKEQQEKYGPNTYLVRAHLKRCKRLTPSEARALATSWRAVWGADLDDAAVEAVGLPAWDIAQKLDRMHAYNAAGTDAMNIVWDVAWMYGDAQWHASWAAIDVAHALVVKDVLPEQYFEALVAPWVGVMGRTWEEKEEADNG